MQKKSIVFVLALLWCAASALAQQPQSPDDKSLPGKVQRLNKAPVNPEILKVTLPHVKEAALPNGLSILVLEQHKVPTVNFTLWIKSGALSDPADQPGRLPLPPTRCATAPPSAPAPKLLLIWMTWVQLLTPAPLSAPTSLLFRLPV
jgi:hypothetical protein